MGGGAQNMQNMIKQAQKMQAEITNVQEEIENETFTATTGGGTGIFFFVCHKTSP